MRRLTPLLLLALAAWTHGTGSSQTLTGLTLSNEIVTPGVTSGVAVAAMTVAVSSGSASGAVIALSTSGSCPGSSANNGNYSVSGTTLSTAANIASETDLICLSVTLAGAANSPQYYAFQLPVVDTPGLSANLLSNNPFYTCVTNQYVNASTGSDSYDGTSPTHTTGTVGPWLTIAHAISAGQSAGYCLNLTGNFTNNTYPFNFPGGSSATTTGYAVVRSYPSLLSAKITQTVNLTNGVVSLPNSYSIVDGLEIDGNATGCSGGPCAGNYAVFWPGNTAHHAIVMNSYIHGSGGGGIGNAGSSVGDCLMALHNVLSQNATTNGNQMSGISIFQPTPISGLTTCGSQWASGFHMQLQWNFSVNNFETFIGDYHSDGDGYILDTFTGNSYTYNSLISNNTATGNGGFCVGVDNVPNAVIANNSCYNDYLDASNPATYRSEIYLNGCTGCTIVNNVVQSVAGASPLSANVSGLSQGTSSGNTWATNIFQGANPVDHTSGGADPISCSTNKCSTSPGWTSVPTAFSAATTGASGTGSTATITWSGSQVLAVGALENTALITPTGYAGTAAITASGAGSASFANATTGAQTVAGVIVLLPTSPNFALTGGSAAIGYGTSKTYLPASDVDAGACGSALATCPNLTY